MATTSTSVQWDSTNRLYSATGVRAPIGPTWYFMTDNPTTTVMDGTIGSIVKLIKVPDGCKILSVYYEVDDIDSGGPTAILDISVIEDTVETVLLTGTTLGQSATSGTLYPSGLSSPDGKDALHVVSSGTNGYGELCFTFQAAATTIAQGEYSMGVWYW